MAKQVNLSENYFRSFGLEVYTLSNAREADTLLVWADGTSELLKQQKAAQTIHRILFNTHNMFFTELQGDKKAATVGEDVYAVKSAIISLSQDVYDIGYTPQNIKLFEEGGKVYFNTYKQSQILIDAEMHKIKNDITYHPEQFPNIWSLLNNLCGEEEAVEWFCKWLGYKLQNPLKRLPTAVIFKGEEGTGKGKLCELVLSPIYGDSFSIIGQSQLNSDKNGYMYGKQFIFCNEVANNAGKFEMSDNLKAQVSDRDIPLREMYKAVKMMINYSQTCVATNNRVAIPIKKGDRRWSIMESSKIGPKGWSIVQNLMDNQEEELIHFINYLMDLDVSQSEVGVPLENNARRKLLNFSENNLETFRRELETSLDDLVDELGGDEYNHYKEDFKVETVKGIFYVKAKLYELYEHWCCHNKIQHKFNRKAFFNCYFEENWEEKKTTAVTKRGEKINSRFIYKEF